MSEAKKTLVLEGLSCANCARKIENRVNKVEGVNKASINFVDCSLHLEIGDGKAEHHVIENVRKIVKDIESHVRVIDPSKTGNNQPDALQADGHKACNNQLAAKYGDETRAEDEQTIINHSVSGDVEQTADEHSVSRGVEQTAVNHSESRYVEHTADNHSVSDEHEFLNRKRILFGIGIVLYAFALLGGLGVSLFALIPPLALKLLYLAAYVLIGGEVLLHAAGNISKGRVFDENFLMSIATIGAIAIGEYPEAVAVMLFYRIGEEFQDAAVNRSRASIKALLDIRPDQASLLTDNGNGVTVVTPETVHPGDLILVKPGERVPLDGIVLDGISQLDTSALTGESMPRTVEPGDEVLSGSINTAGVLKLQVTKEFKDSTVSRILELVQNAAGQKAPTEQFITRFAEVYTPIVVFAALLMAVLPPLLLPGAEFGAWLYRALVFLVISCPCALVISIPLAFFGGIGGASSRGILVKGGNYLEALHGVETVVFDKTGTITQGRFKMVEIKPYADSHGQTRFTAEDILLYAARAETHAAHPAAKAIIEAYDRLALDGVLNGIDDVTDYNEHFGRGVTATVNGIKVAIGNSKLLQEQGIECPEADADDETLVHAAIDGVYAGYIVIADEVKPDAKAAVDALNELGVRRIAILSGDRKAAVKRAADAAGIDEYYGELLPHQKVELMESISGRAGEASDTKNNSKKSKLAKTAFVGDGINDAPVLAMADVGVAMGGIGSDTAIEAADIVLMTDEPMKMVEAIKIARKTRRIVLQNILMALSIKGLVLVMGAAGIASMWNAVFADVGAALLAVLNAIRVLKYRG